MVIFRLGHGAAIIDEGIYPDELSSARGGFDVLSNLFFFLRLDQVSNILDKVFRRLFKIINN
jgi:hypothetical protein